MSQRVLDRLKAALGPKILETRAFRGDEEATVAPADWLATVRFLRDECSMEHFIDITAVDYPERAKATPPVPRFDVLCFVRSQSNGGRVRVRTRVGEGEQLDSLFPVYEGANWTEREVFDMFGIVFRGHPDLRRILMYDEFVGYPLRKDYPIAKTQPLIPYRTEDNLEKLPPFGADEGQPFGRIDWEARLQGDDEQVSPALALQQKQKHALSESSAVQTGAPRKDD